MTDQDQDLKDQFHRLRAADAAWIPSFDRIRSRQRPIRRRPWVPILVLGAAAAVVATVVVARNGLRPAAAPFTFAVGDLRMPTDFLLDVQSVPSVGRSDDWFPNLPGSKGHPL